MLIAMPIKVIRCEDYDNMGISSHSSSGSEARELDNSLFKRSMNGNLLRVGLMEKKSQVQISIIEWQYNSKLPGVLSEYRTYHFQISIFFSQAVEVS